MKNEWLSAQSHSNEIYNIKKKIFVFGFKQKNGIVKIKKQNVEKYF